MNERAWLARLRGKYVEYATLYFDGALPVVPITLSPRLSDRYAYLKTVGGKPEAIIFSSRLIYERGWSATQATLLHELIHVWQASQGLKPDHGKAFKDKARELKISPSASEAVPILPSRKRCRPKASDGRNPRR